MRLDSHQHFWQYDAAQYPWIAPGSPLHRDWLPQDLRPLLESVSLDGCVAVQARQTLEETRWLLELSDQSPIIRAVVGWVDLRSAQVEEQLAAFTPHPRFVGVRHVVQDEPDDRFLLGADFVRGIAVLRQFKLTYDLLIYPRQLPAAIELVCRFPEQPFVLDHIAKPEIRSGVLSPWREDLRELAKHENVCCKLSGMVTEARHADWSPDHFTPYLETVFESFGEDRLMYGSDWPVCLLAAEYREQYELTVDAVRRFSPAAEAKVFGRNAARFYTGHK